MDTRSTYSNKKQEPLVRGSSEITEDEKEDAVKTWLISSLDHRAESTEHEHVSLSVEPFPSVPLDFSDKGFVCFCLACAASLSASV